MEGRFPCIVFRLNSISQILQGSFRELKKKRENSKKQRTFQKFPKEVTFFLATIKNLCFGEKNSRILFLRLHPKSHISEDRFREKSKSFKKMVKKFLEYHKFL